MSSTRSTSSKTRDRAPVRGARALVSLAILSSGCIEWNLDPIDEDPPVKRATVSEIFIQEAQPGVDLLFVLDRTGSMGPELDALASSASLLGAALSASGLSWQLGVVGAEMSTDEAGWLLGTPWILTAEGHSADHFAGIVAEEVPVAEEAGIAAAIEALDLSGPTGVNAGFRRNDASLHVVFVSDGDDASDPWLAGNPVAEMIERLQLEAEEGLPARASAVVGDGTCNDTQRGDRYIEIAEATGGVVVSICAATFAPIVQQLSEASVVLPTSFPLREQPVGSAINVRLDGVSQSAGWTWDAEANAIVFEIPPPARARIDVSYTVLVNDT